MLMFFIDKEYFIIIYITYIIISYYFILFFCLINLLKFYFKQTYFYNLIYKINIKGTLMIKNN